MLYQTLTIETIQEEIEGFKTFTFRPGHGIRYKAGQYLTFVQPAPDEEVRRSYSIVSAPLLDEPLTIGVRRIENGLFSRKLIDHALPGDQLLTTGAGGLFTLPDDTAGIRQIFFLAAGSGITPIYSLLKTVLHCHHPLQAVLVYSNPSPEKTIFLSALTALERDFPERFQLRFLFSNSADLATARLNRELLAQLAKAHSRASFEQTLFFLCGPEAYMRMCTYTLREEGVPNENIRRENFFVPGKRPPRNEPPDKRTHLVTIRYGEEQYQVDVAYPDSILQAARKKQIVLPYSCETGRCGNCAARCLAGQVWMSYNEVLTEKDVQNGLTLTCVGHPVNGDVQLEIKT